MKRLYSKKAFGKLKEFNRKQLPTGGRLPDVEVLWLQLYDKSAPKANRNPHHHTFYELHFVLEGQIFYKTDDGTELIIGAEEYLFIPPGCEHQLVGESAVLQKMVLAFSYLDNGVYVFPQQIRHATGKWFRPVLQTLACALESDNGADGYILQQIIASLILFTADGVIADEPNVKPQPIDERLSKAKLFIEDNSTRNISVQEVAAAVYLSVKQLERLFAQHENIRVSAYIAQARCRAAKALLANRELSVERVAEQLCFSNVYNFSRFFKRQEGITPGMYRQIKCQTK